MYRHPVPIEESLHIIASREYLSGRYGQAQCMILLADGKLPSEAFVKLIRLPQEARISGDSSHVLGWREIHEPCFERFTHYSGQIRECSFQPIQTAVRVRGVICARG